MWDSEIVGAIIGPLLTGLLALIAYTVREQLSVRRWDDERDRALTKATNEVRYIDTWLSALNRLPDSDPEREVKLQRALLDLERSYQVMSSDLADDGTRPRTRTLGEHVRHLLLLDLRKTFPKVLRVFFYLFALMGLLWTAAIISVFDSGSEQGLGLEITGSAIITVLGFLPALLVGIWARAADRDKVRPQPGVPPPPSGLPPSGLPQGPFAGHGPQPGAGPDPWSGPSQQEWLR
ncbi:hypothetical protein HJ590_16825 [Naumannella sp. ID2617S]|nr:hypothetical protein [Naumannella sp. ID2617S]